MSTINFKDYGTKGSEEATIATFLLSVAIEKDMMAQGRSFRPHTYNKWIADSMAPSNKTGFKNGILRGEVLFNRGDWEVGWGKTKGEDLARFIVFTLQNEGVYKWPNVREFVRGLPLPFTNLSEIEFTPESAEDGLLHKSKGEILEASSIHDLLKTLKKVETGLKKELQRANEQDVTLKKQTMYILSNARELKTLSEKNKALSKGLILELTCIVERYEAILVVTKEKRTKEGIQNSLKNAKQRLANMNNILDAELKK
jgi:hypothetical protein